jgi:tetratricopeptide (TPR) repeat protein
MKATFKSPCGRLAVALPVLFLAAEAFAELSAISPLAERTRAQLDEARGRFQADGDNATNAAQLACACYDAADFATNNAERASLAREGIASCRQSIVAKRDYAGTHYYLGMNYGQLAHAEQFWSALNLVREMEHEFKRAAELDPLFDYAGPERNLGLLYLQAPGIVSIGNHRKAREYLESAAKLAPDYPENILNLAEAYLKWDAPDKASVELKLLEAAWPKAQTNFASEAWMENWDNWTLRRDEVAKALEKISLKKSGK